MWLISLMVEMEEANSRSVREVGRKFQLGR